MSCTANEDGRLLDLMGKTISDGRYGPVGRRGVTARLRRRLFGLAAALALTVGSPHTDTAQAQNSAQNSAQSRALPAPILPLSYKVGQIKSLYKLGYVDPLFSEVSISAEDVANYQKDILELRRKISVSGTKNASKKPGWLKRRYLLEGRIYAYRLRMMVEKGDTRTTRLAQKAKRSFVQSAYEYLRSFKPGSAAARKNAVYYNIYSSHLAFGTSPARNLQKIINISKNLSPSLQLRVRYITALRELKSKNSQRAAGAIRSLVRLTKAMPNEVALAIKLSIAQKLRNSRLALPGATYQRFLQSAMVSAKSQSKRTLENAFNYAVAIWLSPKGFRPNWEQPPFSLRGLRAFPMYYAIKERQALAAYQRGDAKRAIGGYKLARRFYKGKKTTLGIDQRILAFQKATAERTGNFALYESGLLETIMRYKDGKILGKRNQDLAKSALAATKKNYLRFAMYAIDQSARPNSGFSPVTAAKVKDRYIKATGMKKFAIPLTAKLADVYAKKGDHRNAVLSFVNLSAKTKGPTKVKYLVQAIRSQRVVTGWPKLQPWQGVARLDEKESDTLGKLNNALLKLQQNNLNWDQAAHIGLLKLKQNNAAGAFNLWKKQMDRDPDGDEARKAAYLMLVNYRQQNQWQNLVAIADLVRAKNIVPEMTGKRLSLGRDLADGLFNAGKEAFGERSYAQSKSYFTKFMTNFGGDPRMPEALYLQANNQKELEGYKEAIGMYRMLVKKYPKSKFFAAAAKEAFLLSITMAFEETTMQIGKIYLRALPNDSFGDQIKPWLFKIFMGRQLYNEAAGLLVMDLKNPKVPAATKALKARDLMNLEEAHGNLGKAFYAAMQTKKYAGDNHSLTAAALRFEGRHTSSKTQYPKLVRLEKSAADLDLSKPGVATALGYLRFRLAEANGSKAQEVPDNASLQFPIKAMTKMYQNFLDVRTFYDRVCEIGDTPYCAPAMFRLAKLAIQQIGKIEGITQPSSLSEEAAAPFDNKKRDIVGYLQDTAVWADNKAVEMVKNGQTDPIWIQQIIWSNSQDWNFEQVTGTGGLGYSQWQPSL